MEPFYASNGSRRRNLRCRLSWRTRSSWSPAPRVCLDRRSISRSQIPPEPQTRKAKKMTTTAMTLDEHTVPHGPTSPQSYRHEPGRATLVHRRVDRQDAWSAIRRCVIWCGCPGAWQVTIQSVVRDVCAFVGVRPPRHVFASPLYQIAPPAGDASISPTRWRSASPTTRATGRLCSTSMASVAELATRCRRVRFPADYQRMLLTTQVWRSISTNSPMTSSPIPTNGCGARRFQRPAIGRVGRVDASMVYGMSHPAGAAVAETATFTYLRKHCVR